MPTSTNSKEKEEGGLFIYGGPKEGELWDVYSWLAKEYRYFHYFYTMDAENLKKHTGQELTELPTVIVHKDGANQAFPGVSSTHDSLNASLSEFVNHERFPYFMKFTVGNLYQVFKVNKLLAMVVVAESKTGILTTDETAEQYVDGYKFRDMVMTVSRNNRQKYHQHFQFGWTGSPYLANNMAITRLPLPSLLIVNTTTQHYYMSDVEAHALTHEIVEQFLDDILSGKAEAYGGDSYPVRVYRALFTARTTLEDMWQGNPVLTALLFGLPLGFLSLIMYSVCCGDILDASDEEGKEEEQQAPEKDHEKTD